MGTGILLFKYATPTDEQLIAAFSPEVRDEYEKSRELRQLEQQELMRIARQTSLSNDPIWKTGAIGSPFEKESRNLNQQIVDYESVKRKQAADLMRKEMEVAKEELKEVEGIITDAKRKWW